MEFAMYTSSGSACISAMCSTVTFCQFHDACHHCSSSYVIEVSWNHPLILL
jgi:hypothetical protein